MSVSQNFIDTLQGSGVVQFLRWLEIEGIPSAYGSGEPPGSFFASRGADEQFLTILPHFKNIPNCEDQDIDVLDAIAKTMGEVTFTLLDKEGDPTLWAGSGARSLWGYLAANLTAGATSLAYTGPTSLFGSSGTIYIGTETITFSSHNTGTRTLSGLSRGRYKSTAQEFGRGFPVSTRPYTMKGRKCWYYQCARTPGGTYVDADKLLRFAGTLENFRMDDKDPGAYVLQVHSLEKKLTKEVFRELRAFTCPQPITGPKGEELGVRTPGTPGWAETADSYAYSPEASKHFDASEFVFARVDNEIIFAQVTSDQLAFRLMKRGCFGTPIEAHKSNWTAKEVVPVGEYRTGSPEPEHYGIKFTSTATVGSPLWPDHPLIFLLQVLLSTGEGTNTSGGRNYDVLPEHWGLGIDIDRVDVAGIEEAAKETTWAKVGGVIEDSMSFVELAQKVLRPLGYYALTEMGDTWTIKYLRPPLPDDVTAELDGTTIRNKLTVGWDANLNGVVQELVFKYSYDLVARDYANIDVVVLNEAKVYTGGEGRRVEYEMPLHWSDDVWRPGKPPGRGFSHDKLRDDRYNFMKQRFIVPPPVIDLTVGYEFIHLNVGNLVSISHLYLPRFLTGLRGLDGDIGEIIKKSVDESSKSVRLAILMTGYNVASYRRFSPSLSITGVSGANITVATNFFTDAKTVGANTQTDRHVLKPDGELHDCFPNSIPVTAYDPQWANAVNTTVSSWSGMVVTLGASLSGAYVGGFIVYRSLDTMVSFDATIVNRFAFLCDSNALLGTSNLEGHKLIP